MAREISVDIVSEIRTLLQTLRDGGGPYPCPETDFLKRICEDGRFRQTAVTKALRLDTTLVKKKRGSVSLLAFVDDEHLIYRVPESLILETVRQIDRPASLSKIAAALALPATVRAKACLTEQLQQLATAGSLFLVAKGYSTEQPPPAVQKKTRVTVKKPRAAVTAKPLPSDSDIIEALAVLKGDRDYPSTSDKIIKRFSTNALNSAVFKKRLKEMAEAGSLFEVKSGKRTSYLLGGDDVRYASKPDENLKFELLTEIEELKARLGKIEYGLDEADAISTVQVHPPREILTIEERVLGTLEQITVDRRRRTIDLWELRQELPDVPRSALDRVIESLGCSRRVELKAVQDATRLSAKQKEGLLELLDGTQVLSLAKSEHGG